MDTESERANKEWAMRNFMAICKSDLEERFRNEIKFGIFAATREIPREILDMEYIDGMD